MISEIFLNIFFCLFGLYTAIRFRSSGRDIIASRRKLEKIIGTPKSQKNFTEKDIAIEQIASLFIGILFFLIGLGRLLDII